MANKRMFSLQIVDTDAFLDMPASSQLLYFHLAMRADDEGFVSSPKRIMKSLGSSDDDYKVLVVKKFVIPFQSGVCVIKHWLIHNTIRMDRFAPTTYNEEKSQLILKDNRAYKLVEIGSGEYRQPTGNQLATQVKLSEVKVSKETVAGASPAEEKFDLEKEIEKMENNPRRDIQIIGLYFKQRKPDIRSREQLFKAIRRHLRPAKELKPFEDDQIIKGFRKAADQISGWTIETAVKMLTK